MVMLAMLGFTNFSRSLPLNDKLLHFVCFCLATGVFYFIFDVEEDARRIWFWRHSGLIFTSITCFFFGGIVSEIVQSMLPYKNFDFGDVVANLLGSGIGLCLAYYIERYYRHRREISRLYRPLNADYISDSDEEDNAQLLPSHYILTSANPDRSKPNGMNKPTHNNLSDVWDEREELFGIGGDSDDEDAAGASAERGRPVTPKITITNVDAIS
jgi:VanZ family protein